ncbi:FG-GAP repeat domain-containing protein [Streptomyces sp. NPDC093105]|uniref:FG-GAP repeat domain-containing protein n=1 Tax=Streptomyces sp. NPDC093105 TaxID=3366029 RepID=UPI00382905B3
MIHARPNGGRIAAAALTVALAAAGVTAPAFAAPGASYAAEDQQSTTVPYPKGYVELLGGGEKGFFTRFRYTVSWTSYATGVSQVVHDAPTGDRYVVGASDVLVTGNHSTSLAEARVFTVRDLASGAQPYVVDLDALAEDGERYVYRGAVGGTLVTHLKKADGTVEGRLVTPGPDGPQQRPVAGLPTDIRGFRVTETTAGTAALVVVAGPEDAPRYTRSVLDVASGTVTDDFPRANPYNSPPVSVSASHVAWVDETAPTRVAVAARGTGGTGPVRTTGVAAFDPYALLGGWLVHGGITRPETISTGGALMAERADGSGTPVRVLDTMGWLVPGPGGSLMARGGSVEHGEGLYRITLDPAGLPVAELVASTGEPSVLVYGGAEVPATIDLSRTKSELFRWKLAGRIGNARVTITRMDGPLGDEPVVIGNLVPMGPDGIGFTWKGEDFNTPGRPAEAGRYSWKFEARQFSGLGEPVSAYGTFTVHRALGLHDFDGNGSPELLTRTGGRAKAVDLVLDPATSAPFAFQEAAFGGDFDWAAYDRLESVGDVAGSRLADVVARDRSGVLWLHQGAGDLRQPLRQRVRIGGGWNTYDKLAGGSDLTGDGRADLVATDRAGVLWLYAGTGNASAPFTTRKRVGGGWGIYNDLTATGNLGGARAGDLVARDRYGVLWLYLGKGDGTFAQRVRIGGGWGVFRQLVGIGDANGDGRQDLLASDGSVDFFYAGTGDWRAPFRAPLRTGLAPGATERF